MTNTGVPVVSREVLEAVAYPRFRKEMDSYAMPLVFEALLRRSHKAWAARQDSNRISFDTGRSGLALESGICGDGDAPHQLAWQALKLLRAVSVETRSMWASSLLVATCYQPKKGAETLNVVLNDAMVPEYVDLPFVPLQRIAVNHEEWRRVFGHTRGFASALRFKLALPLLFMGAGTRPASLPDAQMLELAHRCKWDLRPDELPHAKRLLAMEPHEDGELQAARLPAAPLVRVDGLALDDADGEYMLADRHAQGMLSDGPVMMW